MASATPQAARVQRFPYATDWENTGCTPLVRR